MRQEEEKKERRTIGQTVSHLLTAPGLAAAGFLLAGGKFSAFSFEITSALLAAFSCALILQAAPSRESGLIHSPSARLAVRAAGALFLLLFSAYRRDTFLLGLLLLLFTAVDPFAARRPAAGAFCEGFRNLLLTVSGAWPVFASGQRDRFLFAVLYAAGIFLYSAGLETVRGNRTLRPVPRPGGGVMFSGALLCYLSCVSRMGPAAERTFLSWMPVLGGAVLSAVFLISAWQGFRTFRKGALPGIVRRRENALSGENLFFMESAAAAAGRNWTVAGILLFLVLALRVLKVRTGEIADG